MAVRERDRTSRVAAVSIVLQRFARRRQVQDVAVTADDGAATWRRRSSCVPTVRRSGIAVDWRVDGYLDDVDTITSNRR